MPELDSVLREKIINSQRTELTEHYIYKKLSNFVKEEEYRRILMQISDEELKHYQFFKSLTGEELKQAYEEISKQLKQIGERTVVIYPYSHLSENLAGPNESYKLFDGFFKFLASYGLKADRAPFGWNKAF
ncbi:MAG: threonyl-tRNA synthetase editing domain-containing protein, partial [candidate division WOR-3 bacterium]